MSDDPSSAGETPLNVDPRYVAARRVLLDALAALAPQAHAVIVAGAQALYLRTGGGEIASPVAPFTTDGDLALDPSQLVDDPELEAAMSGAGFALLSQGDHSEPGIWVVRTTIEGAVFSVPVDLIVPEDLLAPATVERDLACMATAPRAELSAWRLRSSITVR
jgi:hypothetical protein